MIAPSVRARCRLGPTLSLVPTHVALKHGVQVWCFVPLREDVRCILPQGVMTQKSGRGTHNERFVLP